jgi:hypothetical protein
MDQAVGIQDMHVHEITKDRAVMPGANGQEADALMTAGEKPTYAGLLKQSGRTRSGASALKSKNEFTD